MTHAGDRLVRFLLDTNFLTIPGKFKVDIFEQLENFGKDQLYTLDMVVRELEGIAMGAGSDASHAKVALHMIRQRGVKVLPTSSEFGHTDAAIRQYAKKRYFTVCTQDRELIGLLKQDRIPVISLRQGRYLERV